MNLNDILLKAVEMKASDLHITVGVPCTIRAQGKLHYLDDIRITPDISQQLVQELTNEKQWLVLMEKGEVDFSYSIPGIQRFRVNAYRQRNSFSAAIRLLNLEIPTIEELGLPQVIKEVAQKNSGLVLVTGPTGSGKSTTLASMIEQINLTKDKHIITLEDPIEYLFKHKKSIINQREIGIDTQSFSNALRACLRQDPDVILVGEMRDYDTISIALTAAETGHLVFSTLHTIGAAATIDRIIDVFPPNQQQQIRFQLAMTLQAVISQQLLVSSNEKSRVAAVEVMLVNTAVRNMIREGKVHMINSTIQTNAMSGMRTMDDSLLDLYRKGSITREMALERAIDMDYLKRMLR